MSMKSKENQSAPVLVIYREGKYDRKLLTVLDGEFGKREYESPIIFFNSDKAYEIRVVTPDVDVTIQGGMNQPGDVHRTWVTVRSELLPRDSRTNRRLALLGLDTTHGEGATIECFGERMKEAVFLGRSFEEDRKELEAKRS